MRRQDRQGAVAAAVGESAEDFDRLIRADRLGPVGVPSSAAAGVVVGTLVAMRDEGRTPLITYAGVPDEALEARSAVDLAGADIGADVVLAFEGGDPRKPVVLGRVRGSTDASALSDRAEVTTDGERLVVTAKQGLVLRCGKASITLSADGRIVVRGTQVVSHASGLNRIRGGSVQLN